MVLALSPTTVFAIYLAVRGGKGRSARAAARKTKNPYLRYQNKPLSLLTCIECTNSHPVLKEDDEVYKRCQNMANHLQGLHYPYPEIVGVVCLAAIARSTEFAKALATAVRSFKVALKTPNVISPCILSLPLCVAKRLGTLQGATIVPKRILPKRASAEAGLC